MKVLLRAVAANQKAPADLWQMLIMAPASITDPRAVMECAGWVINRKSKGMARDVLAMMTNQAHSSLVPAMIRILERTRDDMRMMALDHLISIGDKRAVPALLKVLKKNVKKENDVAHKASRALAAITGQ